MKLRDKVAVVTGASKGIGAAIAKAFAGEGARVVLNFASDENGARAVVESIINDGGVASFYKADVSNEAQVKQLMGAAIAIYGGIDILVNNAGVFEYALLNDISVGDFRRHFDVNFLGTVLCTREAVKHMHEGGAIINVSSAVVRALPASTSIYSASKAAINAFTGVMAKELGARQIRINALCPGAVETEGTRAGGLLGGDWEAFLINQTPLGRLGQTSDIAPAAIFLASDAGAWMTGEVLYLSGGL